MDEQEVELARIIADLGTASEIELQARTLKSVKNLREELKRMEQHGLVKRRPGFFKGGYGVAVELTPEGYKSVK